MKLLTIITALLSGFVGAVGCHYIFSAGGGQKQAVGSSYASGEQKQAVGSPFASAQQKQEADNITVRVITIVDGQGKRRITLGVNPTTNAAALTFYSASDQTPEAVLGIRPDGVTELGFYDETGNRVQLTSASGSPARFSLSGTEHEGLVIAASPQKRIGFVVRDKQRVRLALGVTEHDEAHLTMYDAVGKLIWTAP